jgi:hypothetical protein
MKEIPLTKGKVALVDDEDYDKLMALGYKWSAMDNKGYQFYATGFGNGKSVMMHRVILGITDRKVFVDHADGNGLNNRRGNIRPASRSQNAANRKLRKDSKMPYRGISYAEECPIHPWIARIALNGKRKTIGHYSTAEDAARAYDNKAREVFGEFASLNFPDNSLEVAEANHRELFTIDGQSKSLLAWCREFDIASTTVFHRIKRGWNTIDALTTRPWKPNLHHG